MNINLESNKKKVEEEKKPTTNFKYLFLKIIFLETKTKA